MATQAWLIFTPAQRTSVELLNSDDARVEPREIDNAMADNLGEGTMVGKFVAPARILNDPDFTAFYTECASLPIRTIDSDVLFAPYIPE